MADTILKYVSLANLTKYDEKIKEHIATADTALKSNLEGQVEVVAGALDSEIGRAKAAEQANATAASAAQTAADNLAGKVGTVPENQTVMGIIANIQENAYDDTEVRGLIFGLDTNKADKTRVATDIAAAVKVETNARVEAVAGVQSSVDTLSQTVASNKTAIEGTVSTLEQKVDANESDIEGKMTALTDRVVANETAVGTTLPNAIDEVDAKVDTLIGDDSGKSVRTIANEELAKQLVADGAKESLDTLQEIAQWIQSHPDDASAMNAAITALQNKVDTGDKTVSAYVTDAINALSIGDYAKAADLATLAGRVEALESKFGEGEGSVSDLISNAMDAEEARVDGLLANKVDKVEGKGLSTNDLTDELKGQYDAAYAHSQVAHAPADAQANIIESVKVNGTALTITGKAVDISVPTDNAELTNGAGYLVANDIAGKADKGTTLADYGITDAYTSAQTDEAIANAMAQFEECTQAEIEALFSA